MSRKSSIPQDAKSVSVALTPNSRGALRTCRVKYDDVATAASKEALEGLRGLQAQRDGPTRSLPPASLPAEFARASWRRQMPAFRQQAPDTSVPDPSLDDDFHDMDQSPYCRCFGESVTSQCPCRRRRVVRNSRCNNYRADATPAGDVSPPQAEPPIHSIFVGAVALSRHQKRSCQRRTANTAAKTVAASISRAMTQPWKKLIRSSIAAT